MEFGAKWLRVWTFRRCVFESDVSKKTCVLLELKFLSYPLLYSERWMVVGMRLSAVFVAGAGLINARTISKPVRVYTSSTEMSVCTLNFSICTTTERITFLCYAFMVHNYHIIHPKLCSLLCAYSVESGCTVQTYLHKLLRYFHNHLQIGKFIMLKFSFLCVCTNDMGNEIT